VCESVRGEEGMGAGAVSKVLRLYAEVASHVLVLLGLFSSEAPCQCFKRASCLPPGVMFIGHYKAFQIPAIE
jgi:hypothetical protein